MYDFYLQVLDVLMAIVHHYNRIHFFLYKIIFRGDIKLEDFYFTSYNVGFWILTAFSVGVCFAMIFIPLKEATFIQRRSRKRLKMIMPIGIAISPVPAVMVFIAEIYIVIQWIIRRVKYIFNLGSR